MKYELHWSFRARGAHTLDIPDEEIVDWMVEIEGLPEDHPITTDIVHDFLESPHGELLWQDNAIDPTETLDVEWELDGVNTAEVTS